MDDQELFDVELQPDDGAAVPPQRATFNAQLAPGLAAAAARGATASTVKGRSSRFAYFDTSSALVVVAGPQEGRYADLALAYGMTYRADRQLVLVLPQHSAFPTLQRVPWLRKEVRPIVRVFDPKKPDFVDRPQVSRKAAVDAVLAKAGASPSEDLRKASAPMHLGGRGAWVGELVDWAAANDALDPAHRPNVRSWQCRGQRVLSLTRSSGGGVSIIAGIHYSKVEERPKPLVVTSGDGLTAVQVAEVRAAVEAAVTLRLEKKQKFHKADEHWLQAVLRRDPEVVGIEAPALREVPAWRPKASGSGGITAGWGRGFIDLVGLDAHGEMRLVETKLASNNDEMFILQGLDYYAWAQVYADALRVRLGAAHKAEPVVHFVVGADPTTGATHVSSFAPALADALDVPWRAQVVCDWWTPPAPRAGGATADVLPLGKLPG